MGGGDWTPGAVACALVVLLAFGFRHLRAPARGTRAIAAIAGILALPVLAVGTELLMRSRSLLIVCNPAADSELRRNLLVLAVIMLLAGGSLLRSGVMLWRRRPTGRIE